jgi:hypothetical protein
MNEQKSPKVGVIMEDEDIKEFHRLMGDIDDADIELRQARRAFTKFQLECEEKYGALRGWDEWNIDAGVLIRNPREASNDPTSSEVPLELPSLSVSD